MHIAKKEYYLAGSTMFHLSYNGLFLIVISLCEDSKGESHHV